jgi:hypothetical protein
MASSAMRDRCGVKPGRTEREAKNGSGKLRTRAFLRAGHFVILLGGASKNWLVWTERHGHERVDIIGKWLTPR